MFGFCRRNGKGNGSYHSILGLYRVMEKKTETTIVYWRYMRVMEKNMETTIIQ